MATINTNDLRIKNANNFISSLIPTTERGQGYLFVGRVDAWADDNAPPIPQNNYETFYNVYDNLFALKRIESNNVYNMIPRHNWTSGVVYDYYRQDYSELNRSFTNAANLYDCIWIVKEYSE
jgi:Bacteriophage T4, Gp8.